MPTTAISVISWRGGVGKSTFCVTLASILAKKGNVVLIDADFHAPTLIDDLPIDKNVIGGYFRDFLRGMKSLEEIVYLFSVGSKQIQVIFSNPRVNLWEMNDDVGNRNFWLGEGIMSIDDRMEQFRDFVYQNDINYIIFDLMGGIYYPSLYFSHLSNHTIILSRPSVPQVENLASLINRLDKKCYVVWSNVPNHEHYMEETRSHLDRYLTTRCANRYEPLGYLPHDATLDYHLLKEGFLSLDKEYPSYSKHVLEMVRKLGF